MANTAGRKVSEMSSSVVDRIKQNPVPAALVGIGLGWLIMEGPRSSIEGEYREGYYQGRYRGDYYRIEEPRRGEGRIQAVADEARQKAGDVQAKAEQMAGQARRQAQEIGSEVAEQAEYLADQAQYQAQKAATWFEETMRDNPLVIGAMALALGAAVGMAVPRTRREDRMIGPVRDDLMEKARETAEETAHKVRQVAEQAGEAAKEEAKEEAKNQDLVSESEEPGTPRSSS